MIIGIDASKTTSKQKTGIDNTAYQIILNLQKIDQKNTYYLYTNKPLDKELINSTNFVEKLIPFPRLWTKFRLPLALFKDKPDVFLALTNTIPALAPIKSAVLIHDLAFRFFPEAYSKTELYLQESAILHAINRSKRIIFTSEANKTDFLKFYKYPESQIAILPLACNREVYKKKIISKRPFLQPYFIFVGRLEARKNVSRLVLAFIEFKEKYNTDHKLILVGKKGYGYSEIEKSIQSAGNIKKDIILMGYIDDIKLAELYSNAEAFVFPSLYEGFGLPILEAFACDAPVITSGIDTLKNVAEKSALLVNPLKIEEIATAMEQITFDNILRKRLTMGGKVILLKYSWEKTAKKMLSILEEIK